MSRCKRPDISGQAALDPEAQIVSVLVDPQTGGFPLGLPLNKKNPKTGARSPPNPPPPKRKSTSAPSSPGSARGAAAQAAAELPQLAVAAWRQVLEEASEPKFSSRPVRRLRG